MSDLGDRMKSYERAARTTLPPRAYSVLRADGRAFHTWTRHRCTKPFDPDLAMVMDATAEALCQDIAGARFAYVQSDEISVVFDDLAGPHSEPWFGGGVQKIVSVAASRATATFNRLAVDVFTGPDDEAMFDARVFTVALPVEVGNYLLWRVQDATRNSISMAAQAQFSHRQLQGVSADQMQEMLWTEKGVNWNHYPARFKRGRLLAPVQRVEPVTFTDRRTDVETTTMTVRRRWRSFVPSRDMTAQDVAGWLEVRDESGTPKFAEER